MALLALRHVLGAARVRHGIADFGRPQPGRPLRQPRRVDQPQPGLVREGCVRCVLRWLSRLRLTPDARHRLAFWLYGDFVVAGAAPYLDLPATGMDTYGRTGRGYPRGRFRGERLVYGEAEYRWTVTKNGLFGIRPSFVYCFLALPGRAVRAATVITPSRALRLMIESTRTGGRM